MSTTASATPRWDLSALFSGLDDLKIAKTWETAKTRSEAFEKAYRGKINADDLTAETLRAALAEYEDLYMQAVKPILFANLLFAADSSDAKIGSFLQKQQEKVTELNVKLMFVELELQAASDEVIERIVGDAALDNYRHFIEAARKFRPHRLSEPEEIILEETANTGSRAWQRLFDEVTANHVYTLHRPGKDQAESLSEQELLALLRDPDRAVRQAAADAFSAGLAQLQRVLTFTFNNLLNDKAIDDRLRSYSHPEQARHMANELEPETVELVIRLCRENYGLVERFYNVKRLILGLPELTHIDRYAPLFEAKEKVEWARAQQIVLEAFGAFSPELAEKGKEFFDKNWIDAESRKGKGGGAFCSYNTPDTHPVLLQTYLDRMDDVMTLAHELGHGVHASYSREQTYFNFHGTLPLAELASTFGEMLVFEKLVAGADVKDRLALYAEKIEGIFATVFRQAAFYGFEKRVHHKRREDGELEAGDIGDIWQEELQAMFGNSVKLGEQHRTWWSYISHFIQSPFYVYAYSFGELLVLSLYEMAKQEGPTFAGKYTALLRLGGSKSPADLMATVGVDLQDEAFWKGGFVAMEKLVAQFERLWSEVSAQA